MKTIAFLGQKGGGGKTTLLVHCAVAAVTEGSRLAIADTDPQATAFQWGQSRESDVPVVIKATAQQLDDVLRASREDKMQYVFIDSAPHAAPSAFRVASAADLVLLPIRPTAFDLGAVQASVDIVRAAGRKAAFVLSACPSRAPEIDESRDVLMTFGLPVCPVVIHERRAYARAVATGRAVSEFEPAGKAAVEIAALWAWLKKELK